MNTANFIGHISQEPELRYLPNNTAVLDFSIAVNERVKKGDQWEDYASFFDITAFGKQAEAISRNFYKGKPIGLTCRAKQERWKDKQTDANRSKVKFIVMSFDFIGKKDDADQVDQRPKPDAWGRTEGQPPIVDDRGHEPLVEDDIPF